MSATEIIIPKPPSYKLPEGRFRAQISHVSEKVARDGSNMIYIHFIVMVMGMEQYECRARACLPAEFNGNLKRFLEALLGQWYFTTRAGQGIVLKDILPSMWCDIQLVHGIQGENYDWPIVEVVNVYPVPQPEEEQTRK